MEPKIRGEFPKVIDSTIRASFVSCPTKFYWSFVRKLGSPYPSIDLIAGGAFARGLEVVRKDFYGLKLPLPQALEHGMLEAITAFGDVAVPENKEKKGVDRVVSALAAYFEQYPPDLDVIQPRYDADGMPMVEFNFGIPLPILHPESREPLIYAGRFDLVGLYNGQCFGVDEKTTSMLGATWSNQWNLRGQFTGYCWAMRELGLPVAGMIARGVSFLKNGFGFAESIQLRSQWQIDTWYAQLLADIRRAVAAWESGWYDQDFNETCASYGGCSFQRLCTTQDPDSWIEGYYAPREWNPLSKVPEAQPESKPVEIIHDPLLAQLAQR